MNKQQELLRDIELQWPNHIRRGIGDLVRAHPDSKIYAAAFWQFYCDYTVIHPPAFGANAENDGEEGTRWAPAEWRWVVLSKVFDGMLPPDLQLSESVAESPEAEWEAVVNAHYALISRITRSVTKTIRNRSGIFHDLSLPDNFLSFAVDVEADGATNNRLLRASIDEATLPTLEGILWPGD